MMLVRVFGLASLKGCPDADGDGIADKDDKCPTVAGLKITQVVLGQILIRWCFYDKDDMCPTVAGPAK
jgi:hypothetical protein